MPGSKDGFQNGWVTTTIALTYPPKAVRLHRVILHQAKLALLHLIGLLAAVS